MRQTEWRIGRIAALAALALVLLPPVGAGAARDRCAVRGSKTEQRTKQVRVYTTVRRTNWFACYRRTGLKTRLDEPRGRTFGDGGGVEDRLYLVRVAGPYVAFWQSGADYPTGVEEEGGGQPQYFSRVSVANAKRGYVGLSHDLEDEDPQPPAGAAPRSTVTDLVLRPTGSVAWVADDEGRRRVDALSSGDFRTLDSGTGIDPDSLELQGSTLSWTNGGQEKTATLR